MHMNNATFGTWAGTAINDTSSVVAAGYTYSQSAGDLATIVKLSRALMIVPACLIFAGVRYIRSQNSHQKVDLRKFSRGLFCGLLWRLLLLVLGFFQVCSFLQRSSCHSGSWQWLLLELVQEYPLGNLEKQAQRRC